MNGSFSWHLTLFALVVSLLMMSGCSRSPAGKIESVLKRCGEISKEAAAGQANAAGEEINNTYYRLTLIAAQHGARVRRSIVQ